MPVAPGRSRCRRSIRCPAAKDRDLNDTDWHWDAAHNPLPLSPAQAGLVSLVDEQCRIGLRQRVVGGYLFYATDPDVGDDADRRRRCAARRVGGGRASGWRARRRRWSRRWRRSSPSISRCSGSCSRTRARRPACSRRSCGRSGFDPAPLLPKLLSGVSSAATERARRARTLAEAIDPKLRAGGAGELPGRIRRRGAALGRRRADLA